jgi:mono/diheme cytochrome c family protein
MKRVGLVALAALVAALSGCQRDDPATDPAAQPSATSVAKGEYLARIGNCGACHTARGGEAFAGGRGIATPFGIVHAPNITPDATTGLGHWTRADFRRALRDGRSKDGHLLYPAFPYANTTRMAVDDIDALFDYLRSVPPVNRPNRAHALDFPYDQAWLLGAWRALYFTPGSYAPDTSRSASWNRGAYLVQGVAHCDACHSQRNALGGIVRGTELAGGTMPGTGWYAPSLRDPHEAGLAGWTPDDAAHLLATGVAPGASVSGPMAEVVFRGTQHLTPDDRAAIVEYVQSLPQVAASRMVPKPVDPRDTVFFRGAKIYTDHCADCHGRRGEGREGAYPALSGNRAVTMPVATNVIRAVLSGGFAPATAGNPRPFGMPPFAQSLGDADIAAVVTYIRNAWGNAAAPVSAVAINRERGARVEQ